MEFLWDVSWCRLANGKDRGASVFSVPGLLDPKVEYYAILRNVCIYSAFFYRLPEPLLLWVVRADEIPYILESNPHPFYSFRGLKNQMRIRFAVESWILEK